MVIEVNRLVNPFTSFVTKLLWPGVLGKLQSTDPSDGNRAKKSSMGCLRANQSCPAGSKKSKGLVMKKAKYAFVVAGLSLSLCAITKAREIQFTTLPEVVRTTVIHKYNVVSPEKVVRVVEEPDNIYELTVVTETGNQIVYVKTDGTIVERPGEVVETREGTESQSVGVIITLDQVKSAGERYEFVQDQGPDAIYIDHETNKRVIV